jgi:hypothetical protein
VINSIESIFVDDDATVYVSAVVEDMIQIHRQTYYEPAEYGPALCEASFELSEDCTLPDNDHELIQFLENLDLDWQVVDNSDEYID